MGIKKTGKAGDFWGKILPLQAMKEAGWTANVTILDPECVC